MAVIAKQIPFMVCASGAKPILNTARIAESLVIAALAGIMATAGTVYVMTERMDVKVQLMQSSIERLERQIEDMRADLYQPRAIRQ